MFCSNIRCDDQKENFVIRKKESRFITKLNENRLTDYQWDVAPCMGDVLYFDEDLCNDI